MFEFTYFPKPFSSEYSDMVIGGEEKPKRTSKLLSPDLILVTIIHAINIREYSTSMSDNFSHAHFLLMILPVLPNCSNGETLS